MKKTLCTLMSVLLMISVFSFCASADYQNTYKNTGKYSEDIVGAAKTQIGYSAAAQDNKYIKRFTDDSGSASASFIAWCAEQAGVPSSVLSYKGTLESLIGRFEDAGKINYSSVLGGDYSPKIGDIIFITTVTGDFSKCSNAGIVSSVSDSKVEAIFGDVNSAVTLLSYDISDTLILGYASPDYSSITPYVTGRYKTTTGVNFRNGPSAENAKVLDSNSNPIVIPKGTIVTVSAISGGWGYTKYANKNGWICLEYASYYSELPPTENTEPDNTDLDVKWNMVDVSGWQDDIDWERVSNENIQGAIIRIGVRYSKSRTIHLDSKFDRNCKEAAKYSVPVGCYFYTVAYSVADAQAEAEFVVKTLNDGGYQMDFPVYFDVEDESMRSLGRTLISEITNAFCEVIEDAGYLAGIYCSKSWADSYLNEKATASRPMWIAQWDVSKCTYSGAFGLWQYSDKGSVDGINGYVDLNICYLNYPYYIKSNGYNGYKKPTPAPKPTPDPVPDPNPDDNKNIEYEEKNLKVTVTPAGCTKYGSVKKADKETGEVVSFKLINPTGHAPEANIGTDSKLKCTQCGEVLIDISPEHVTHKYTLKEVIPATCTTEGKYEVFCETCGNISVGTSVIPVKTHENGDHTIKDATCKENGRDEIKCSVCGEITEYDIIPTSGHQCDNWTVITKPDSTGKVGLKRGVCKICGEYVYVRTEYDPNEKPDAKPGDIDMDGKITVSDARLLLRFTAKMTDLTSAQKNLADVNKDGKITAADARLVLRVAAKLEVLS